MKFTKSAFALVVAGTTMLSATAASASTLPKMDFTRTNIGVGVGTGGNVSIDFPLGGAPLTLGAAIGIPGWNATDANIRLLWRFLGDPSTFNMGLILAADAAGSSIGSFGLYSGQAGLGFAYPFTDHLVGRLNLMAGYGSGGFSAMPSGAELGWKFSDSFELTLGYSGRGDILGLNWTF